MAKSLSILISDLAYDNRQTPLEAVLDAVASAVEELENRITMLEAKVTDLQSFNDEA